MANRILKPATLAQIVDRPMNDNMRSVCAGLDSVGFDVGLNMPHRLCHFIGQIAHESGRFRYDREVWNGRGAQARYDTRTDLGNTPERDGDGYKYRGRTGIQITGLGNTTAFRQWCRARFPDAPDFVEDPDAMLTDPWEGLGPLWYWDTRHLNRYADQNNIEMITRRINGGLNGYADRLGLYDRAALVVLGFAPDAVRAFQSEAQIRVDGESGPQTRGALHAMLLDLPRILPVEPSAPAAEPEVAPFQSLSPDQALAQIRDILAAVSPT